MGHYDTACNIPYSMIYMYGTSFQGKFNGKNFGEFDKING